MSQAKCKKRFNQRTKALLLTVVLFVLMVVVYASGLLIPEEAVSTDVLNAKQPPSWGHLFGTDNLGRDLLMRTLKGMSVSMTVGIAASCISAVIAVLIGIAAATGSKWMDGIISWVIDLMMGIPHTVLIILISFSLGRGLKGLLAGIAATHWTSLARLIRGRCCSFAASIISRFPAAWGNQADGYCFIIYCRIWRHSLSWDLY